MFKIGDSEIVSFKQPIRSHGTTGIFTYMTGWFLFVNVGKYTSPMDAMGEKWNTKSLKYSGISRGNVISNGFLLEFLIPKPRERWWIQCSSLDGKRPPTQSRLYAIWYRFLASDSLQHFSTFSRHFSHKNSGELRDKQVEWEFPNLWSNGF